MSNKLTEEDVERLRFQADMERKGWKLNPYTGDWIQQTGEGTNVKADWQAYRDWKVQREGVIGGR